MSEGKQLTPIGQICVALDKMESGFGESLKGTGIAPARFLATAKMAVQTHTDKDKLASADRQSLYLAVKKAAGDGLLPDNREAALVVYGNQVQYQPMVQGLVKLARQSGEIESINSEVVYENDVFELYFDMGETKFSHRPNWKEDRGNPILVWASVKLKSGEMLARAYPKKRIDQIATRSRMSANYDPQRGKDWEEFWRKAAIRNILKYAPKTTQLEQAMDAMDGEFQEEIDIAPPEKQSAQKTQTRAAAKIKEVQEAQEEPQIIDLEVVQEYPVQDALDDETDIPI